MKTKDDGRSRGARQSEGGQGQTKPRRGQMDAGATRQRDRLKMPSSCLGDGWVTRRQFSLRHAKLEERTAHS